MGGGSVQPQVHQLGTAGARTPGSSLRQRNDLMGGGSVQRRAHQLGIHERADASSRAGTTC